MRDVGEGAGVGGTDEGERLVGTRGTDEGERLVKSRYKGRSESWSTADEKKCRTDRESTGQETGEAGEDSATPSTKRKDEEV